MIKNITASVFAALFLFACQNAATGTRFHQPDWSAREITIEQPDSLYSGATYLPVYAQIYHISEENKVNLAATVSIHNTDLKDKIYLEEVSYYDTGGKMIRSYLKSPVFVKPCETLEIIIKSEDNEGGTGANFIFKWKKPRTSSSPLFESVMITTAGQQGIAFTCRGVELR